MQDLSQGDINCDGVIGNSDFMMLLLYAADLIGGQQNAPCPDINEPVGAFNWGDVNCDGVVDGVDALFIALFAGSLETPAAGDPGCVAVGDTFL